MILQLSPFTEVETESAFLFLVLGSVCLLVRPSTPSSPLSIYFAVFVYSMPGYKCSIKDRMLYSTCKGPLLDVAASLGLEIEKKVSI